MPWHTNTALLDRPCLLDREWLTVVLNYQIELGLSHEITNSAALREGRARPFSA